MPSGVPINPYSLRLIAFNIEHAILSIEELIQIIQVIDNVAEVTIRRHCSELSGFSVCKRKECVENSKKSSTGRPRLMDDADESFLMSIFKQKPFYRLRSIKILYNHLTDSHLSTSTLSRSLARSCFTLKKVHKESLLPDVNEQANFLDNIKYFEWRAFISVDETSGKRSKVSPTHGRSLPDEELNYYEWHLNDKLVSVIAAFSPFGFLCWRIFYDTPINAASVRQFLEDDLARYINKHTIVLLDNASIYKTFDTLDVLDNVCNSRYAFIPAFSYRYSPIERGFGLVWNYVQGYEDQARLQREPLVVLHEAFWVYSIYGPYGDKALNEFNLYKNNRHQYENEMDAF